MKNLLTVLTLITLAFVFLFGDVSSVSTYGKPNEFGNSSTTTCWIGGDAGNLTCQFNITSQSGYFIGDGSLLSGVATTGGWTDSLSLMLLNNSNFINSTHLIDYYPNSTELNLTYALNSSLSNYDTWAYNQTKVDSVTSNLTLTGTLLGINGANIKTWLDQIYQAIGSYLTSTELNVSYVRHEFINNSYALLGSDTNASSICSGTDEILLSNGTCYQIIGREWINPGDVFDIDDEDIETDLNTYVDIGGDTMTGDLLFGSGNNITLATDGNLSSGSGTITHNSTCWLIKGASITLEVC